MSPLVFCRFAQTTAAVLLAGTAVLRLLAWGTNRNGPTERWGGLVWTSCCILVVTGALQLVLTAAEMSGQTLSGTLSGGAIGMVLKSTRFGSVWKARAAFLAATFVIEALMVVERGRVSSRSLSRTLQVIGTVLTGGLLATVMWSGHAQSSQHRAWLFPVNLLHVLAAGAWPGGLFPLGLILLRAGRDPGGLPAAVTITRRFSLLSLLAVGTLGLTGLLNAAGLVGTFAALWPSVYGRLLLCKVALFAAMVGLGAANRMAIRRKSSPAAAQTLRNVCRTVAWESALAVCVLLATEALAMSPPPASSG